MDLLEEYSVDELEKINVNFITVGGQRLAKKAWVKDRGLRVAQNYIYNPTNETKIKESYSYVYDNGGREVSSYVRKLTWQNNDSDLLHEIITTPDLTITHIKEVNKSARNAQIDYLELSADNLRNTAETLPEPYKTQYNFVADKIDLLLTHYEPQIRKYRERNLHTMDFENALNNETDQNILGIFSIPVRQPDAFFPNGLTVFQAIMYQLKGLIP